MNPHTYRTHGATKGIRGMKMSQKSGESTWQYVANSGTPPHDCHDPKLEFQVLGRLSASLTSLCSAFAGPRLSYRSRIRDMLYHPLIIYIYRIIYHVGIEREEKIEATEGNHAEVGPKLFITYKGQA